MRLFTSTFLHAPRFAASACFLLLSDSRNPLQINLMRHVLSKPEFPPAFAAEMVTTHFSSQCKAQCMFVCFLTLKHRRAAGNEDREEAVREFGGWEGSAADGLMDRWDCSSHSAVNIRVHIHRTLSESWEQTSCKQNKTVVWADVAIPCVREWRIL